MLEVVDEAVEPARAAYLARGRPQRGARHQYQPCLSEQPTTLNRILGVGVGLVQGFKFKRCSFNISVIRITINRQALNKNYLLVN